MIRRLAAVLATVSFASCVGPELDLTPPRVVAISPERALVETNVRFEVEFSESMDVSEEIVNDNTVVLVERADATEAFVNDVNSPPLSESRVADLIPISFSFADDNTLLIVEPRQTLRPLTAYSLLLSEELRDEAGGPLSGPDGLQAHFRFDFTTDGGPPTVDDTDFEDAIVPTNRRRFTILMNQPVQGADKDSIGVVLREGGGNVSVESIELDETRSVITIVLDDVDGCERFAPSADYAISLTSAIRDDQGRSLVPVDIPFSTSAQCQTERNRLLDAATAVATDVNATVKFSTNHASAGKVWYGVAGDELDCAGNVPCPVVGAPVSDGNDGEFVHSIVLSGLVVDQTYAFRVAAEDNYGFVATGQGAFTTAELAKVAINEYLADVDGEENEGEFIELVNFGDTTVDLAGYSIFVEDNDCSFPDVDLEVEAGGYVVLATDAFNPELYNTDPTHVVAMGSTVCGSLVNSRAQPMELRDPDGRPVSSFGGYANLEPKTGRSVERVTASDADVNANFCYSRSDYGPTPGEQNGVTLHGCETDPGSQ